VVISAALLAQSLQNTIALYHAMFGAACERMPNICFQPPMRSEWERIAISVTARFQ
jgi:hypothetical protein